MSEATEVSEKKPSILIISHHSDVFMEIPLEGFLTKYHGCSVVAWDEDHIDKKGENLNTQFQTKVNAADVVVLMISPAYKEWKDATFVTEAGQEHSPISAAALSQQLINQRGDSVYLVQAGDCYGHPTFFDKPLFPQPQGIGCLLDRTSALQQVAEKIIEFSASIPAEKPNFTLDVSPSSQSLSDGFNAAAPESTTSQQPKISRSRLSL
ncbi:MAG: hypothetical protein ACOYK8_00800 [Alphaproteobacteria bacterium]